MFFSRLLAADIKSAICGGKSSRRNNTAECASLLNIPAWSLDKFVGTLVSSPGGLLRPNLIANLSKLAATLPKLVEEKASDDFLWDGPDAAWVACNQHNQTCYGGMKKSDWHSKRRGENCVDAFQKQVLYGNVNSSTVGIDICNLNDKLNQLCIDLAVARSKVFEANCIYKGACSPRVYVYTPGIYSITNEDFVRGTVTHFYEMYAPNNESSEDICPMDDLERELILRNENMTRSCSSKQLERVHDALRIARRLVHLVVEATWYFISLVLALLRLLLPMSSETIDSIIGEIQFWFVKLILLLSESLKQIANLFFRVIFDSGGFGSAMKTIIELLCQFANFIIVVWNWTGCVFARDVVNPILGFLINILRPIISLFSPDDGGIIALLLEINRAIDGLTCDYSLNCTYPDTDKIKSPTGALPVASSCWADYVPGVDESDAFSCSRSDTCRVSTLESGVTALEFGGLADSNREVLCDSCPTQQAPGNAINQYGCDTMTKQCTCNRPKREKTFCTSNDQCYLKGAICSLVNDYSTGAGYGSTECASCSRISTCHITDMSTGIGKCSCMQTDTSMLSCTPSSVGQRVMPDPSQVCAVISTGRSSSFYYDWNSLATAPCALVSPGMAYCYSVREYGYLVVGTGVSGSSVFGSRRRLLEENRPENQTNPDIDWNQTNPDIDWNQTNQFFDWNQTNKFFDWNQTNNFWDWEHTAQPCRSLSDAGKRGGVLDDLAWQSCMLWRQVGASFIEEFNITSLQPADEHDHFLLSFRDLASVIRRKNVVLQLYRTGTRGLNFLVERSQASGDVQAASEVNQHS